MSYRNAGAAFRSLFMINRHKRYPLSKIPEGLALDEVPKSFLLAQCLPSDVFTLQVPTPNRVRQHKLSFDVPLHYNKYQIKNYLEQLYSVRVESVNTHISTGTETRSFTRGRAKQMTWTSSVNPSTKVAIVTFHPQDVNEKNFPRLGTQFRNFVPYQPKGSGRRERKQPGTKKEAVGEPTK